MAKEDQKEITIVSSNIQEGEEAFTIFPTSVKAAVAKSTKVAVQKFRENLSEFLQLLGETIEGLPGSCGGYQVDTLTFSLSVNAAGKISLIGELAAGCTSGITITLTKGKRA